MDNKRKLLIALMVVSFLVGMLVAEITGLHHE